jgi:ribosomal protein S18 acetylase RimI-like enzyme
VTSIRPARADDVDGCVAVLEALADWFTPDTHDEVRQHFPDAVTWVAIDDAEGIIGFVLAESRYPGVAELLFAGVVPERRGQGLGTGLVDATLADLAGRGVDLVEVKTLDARAGYEPYVATRAFWHARGFRQIDCIDPLPGWAPGNPAAICVRVLGTASA